MLSLLVGMLLFGLCVKLRSMLKKRALGVMTGLSVVLGAERFGILIEEKPACILTKDWSLSCLCMCGILRR